MKSLGFLIKSEIRCHLHFYETSSFSDHLLGILPKLDEFGGKEGSVHCYFLPLYLSIT